MMSAPASSAALATSALVVSTDINTGGNAARNARTTGMTLRVSSSTETTVAPCGRVDSPPTSIASAPWASMSRA
jgi:hypothetical protein